jgi:hypothetical protein
VDIDNLEKAPTALSQDISEPLFMKKGILPLFAGII